MLRKVFIIILILNFNFLLLADNISLNKVTPGALAKSNDVNGPFTTIETFINGRNLDGLVNIKAQGIFLSNLFDGLFNSTSAVDAKFDNGVINIDKANQSDWFTSQGISNSGGLKLDFNSTYFKLTTGQLDIVDNSIISDLLDVSSLASDVGVFDSGTTLIAKVDTGLVIDTYTGIIQASTIDINGDGNEVTPQVAIQTSGETLATDDTSSLINAINSAVNPAVGVYSPYYFDSPIILASQNRGAGSVNTTDSYTIDISDLTNDSVPTNSKKLLVEFFVTGTGVGDGGEFFGYINNSSSIENVVTDLHITNGNGAIRSRNQLTIPYSDVFPFRVQINLNTITNLNYTFRVIGYIK